MSCPVNEFPRQVFRHIFSGRHIRLGFKMKENVVSGIVQNFLRHPNAHLHEGPRDANCDCAPSMDSNVRSSGVEGYEQAIESVFEREGVEAGKKDSYCNPQ